jgi:hypothetical protein
MLASFAVGKVPAWLLQRAMFFLMASIILTVFFLLIFSRGTEAAINRQDDLPRDQKVVKQGGPIEPTRGGRLNNIELGLILSFAFMAITAFMWGFLYLGRIVFVL